MGILTAAEIMLMLDTLSYETVVEPSKQFPYKISKQRFGYLSDKNIGALQAKLSIMLEVAQKSEARSR